MSEVRDTGFGRVRLMAQTIRHTSARQGMSRVGKVARQRLRRSAPRLCVWWLNRCAGNTPRWRERAWLTEAPLVDAQHAVEIARDISDGRFTFLGTTLELGRPVNWTPDGVSYLWTFNLHYFEYLEALRAAGLHEPAQADRYGKLGAELMRDWIEHHRYPDWPGWEPYPIAERLLHWQRFLAVYPDARDETIRESICRQVVVLRRNVEYDLANNHVMVNLAGLLAGLAMLDRSPRIGRWTRRASEELTKVLREQLTADGTLVERSAMYHSLMLSRLVMLRPLQRAGWIEVPGLDAAIARMAASVAQYRFGAGGLAHFHDSADGIAPPAARLVEAVEEMGIGSSKVGPGGSRQNEAIGGGGVVWARRELYECAVDGDGPAPPHSPGHCHASIGSFIVHWAGRPCVVDPGCSTYDAGEVRRAERGTAAHNTVCVDGLDQSQMWSRFRIGRRARVTRREYVLVSDCDSFVIEQDGYEKSVGVAHLRRFLFGERFIVVVDRLAGGGKELEASSLLTFAPDVTLDRDGERWLAKLGNGQAMALWLGGMWEAQEVRAFTAEQFGVRVATAGLRLAARTTPAWMGVMVMAAEDEGVTFDEANDCVAIGKHVISINRLRMVESADKA